jgi:succinate dehydrogenase/fumarate reductase flavoprotein subunit
LLDVSETVARSAAGRPESRGAHSRIDHLDKDPALGKVNTLVQLGADGSIEARHMPVVGRTDELQAIVTEMG